jgi:biopolymer transport protein ExbD/biopolymer transport protein TolR
VKDLLTARTGDKSVYIKSDARARFGAVTDVIDQLRTDGVDQLGLLTEEIQDKNKKGLSL